MSVESALYILEQDPTGNDVHYRWNSTIVNLLYDSPIFQALNDGEGAQKSKSQVRNPQLGDQEQQSIFQSVLNGASETIHTDLENQPKPNASSHKNYEKFLCSPIRQILKDFIKNSKLKKKTDIVQYCQMFWDEIKAGARPSLKTIKKFLINPGFQQDKNLNQRSSQKDIKFVDFLKFKTLEEIEKLREQTKEMILSQKGRLIDQAGKRQTVQDPVQFAKYMDRFLKNLGQDKIEHGDR